MLGTYRTVGTELVEVELGTASEKGTWINLIAPTEEEINKVSLDTGICIDFLRYPLDDEERPRIEYEEGQILILINVPIIEPPDSTKYPGENVPSFNVIPLGIIITNKTVVTVCLRENPVINQFLQGRVRGLFTFKRTRFLLQVLYKTAVLFLVLLRQIDKRSNEIENALHRSTENRELLKLLKLEKSLVYFTTALKSNDIVMEKLLKHGLSSSPVSNSESGVTKKILQFYPEDEDLLEDILVENRQALQMADIYSSILAGTMDAFASIISNNLNIVMRFLTVVTIVLTFPTMVASFYGMNVALPFQHSTFAFWGTVALSSVLAIGSAYLLKTKRIF